MVIHSTLSTTRTWSHIPRQRHLPPRDLLRLGDRHLRGRPNEGVVWGWFWGAVLGRGPPRRRSPDLWPGATTWLGPVQGRSRGPGRKCYGPRPFWSHLTAEHFGPKSNL